MDRGQPGHTMGHLPAHLACGAQAGAVSVGVPNAVAVIDLNGIVVKHSFADLNEVVVKHAVIELNDVASCVAFPGVIKHAVIELNDVAIHVAFPDVDTNAFIHADSNAVILKVRGIAFRDAVHVAFRDADTNAVVHAVIHLASLNAVRNAVIHLARHLVRTRRVAICTGTHLAGTPRVVFHLADSDGFTINPPGGWQQRAAGVAERAAAIRGGRHCGCAGGDWPGGVVARAPAAAAAGRRSGGAHQHLRHGACRHAALHRRPGRRHGRRRQ